MTPRRWLRLATAAALLLALGGALAAAIVVIMRDKDGKEVFRATVPDDDSAEVKSDRDRGKLKADRRAAEWVLSIGGTIKVRQGGQEREIQVVNNLPPAPVELVTVNLNLIPKVEDAGLEHLKGLTKLTWLGLVGTRVSDAGLEHLKGLTKLTWLDLGGTQVSDAGLVHLKELTNLTGLSLAYTQTGDAGLVHLKGLLKNLSSIALGRQVTDVGLVHLKGLTKVTYLDLPYTEVSDAGLIHLKEMTKLTQLGLYGTRVSDAGLVHLKGLTNLAWLDLRDTRVSDAGLRSLVNLPVTGIDLHNSRVSARGFASLRRAFPLAHIIGEAKPSLVEDMLAEGATLTIRAGEAKEDLLVKKIADLPRESFLVRRADCTGVKNPLGELLARLSRSREYEFERLEALDVSGSAISRYRRRW
jgi:hypothetical protein